MRRNWIAAALAMMMPAVLHAAPPEPTNSLRGNDYSVHELLFLEDASSKIHSLKLIPAQADLAQKGEPTGPHMLESQSMVTPFPFNELLPSWNIDGNDGTFRVEFRVGKSAADGAVEWSRWFCFEHPTALSRDEKTPMERSNDDSFATLKTDYLVCKKPCDRLQARVTLAPGLGDESVHRLAICISNTLGDRALAKRFNEPRRKTPDIALINRRLPVPFKSQHVADKEMKGNICSPTSVAMVLAFRGHDITPQEAAKRAFDPLSNLFGNWPRNVQMAYRAGVPGYVTRFRRWESVQAAIAANQPVIASIRDPEGLLKNAAYGKSNGHLIVICGFDPSGAVLVNDPAGRDARSGQLAYDRATLEKIWFERGGVAYILEDPTDAPPKDASGGAGDAKHNSRPRK